MCSVSPRVLLVASDLRFRMLMADFLRLHEFRVDPLPALKSAVALLANCQTALIIYDSYSPADDGVDFVRAVREVAPVAPIVFLVAVPRPPEEDCSSYGVEEIFLKPFDLDDFVATISALIHTQYQRA